MSDPWLRASASVLKDHYEERNSKAFMKEAHYKARHLMGEFLPRGSSSITNDKKTFEDHDDDRLASFLRRKKKRKSVNIIWGSFQRPPFSLAYYMPSNFVDDISNQFMEVYPKLLRYTISKTNDKSSAHDLVMKSFMKVLELFKETQEMPKRLDFYLIKVIHRTFG